MINVHWYTASPYLTGFCDFCTYYLGVPFSISFIWLISIDKWFPFISNLFCTFGISHKTINSYTLKTVFFFFLLHKTIQQCLATEVMCYSFHIQEIFGDTWIYFSLPKQERTTDIQCLGKRNVAKPSTKQKITPKQKIDLNYMSTAPRLANLGLPWWIRQ